jgi:hypothetical protein
MEDQATWDYFFAAIVGWQHHPGNYKDNAQPLSIEECAEYVNEMMKVREEKSICRG